MKKPDLSRFNVRFECLSDCSNCCRISGGFVFLTDEEAAQMSVYLNTSHEMFREWFTKSADNRLALVDGEHEHCVFLEEGACIIYPVRPQQCRTFPFWPENMKTKAHWNLTKKTCPGIGIGQTFSTEKISAILKGKDLYSKR